jgi:hypothetical protein
MPAGSPPRGGEQNGGHREEPGRIRGSLQGGSGGKELDAVAVELCLRLWFDQRRCQRDLAEFRRKAQHALQYYAARFDEMLGEFRARSQRAAPPAAPLAAPPAAPPAAPLSAPPSPNRTETRGEPAGGARGQSAEKLVDSWLRL